MGPGSSIALLRRSSIVDRCLRLLLGWLAVEIGNTIRIGRSALGLVVMPAKIVWMTIIAASWLRDVRNDLHTTGNDTSWTSTASGVRGGSRASKSLGQLLYQRLADVICSDMYRIGDPKHDKRAFG